MVREGTRSQTGNSKPRIFPVVDTAPVTARKRKPAAKSKTAKKVAGKAEGAKPKGVTKKKAPAKKDSVGEKVKAAAKKVEKKVTGEAKTAKKDTKAKENKAAAKVKAATK